MNLSLNNDLNNNNLNKIIYTDNLDGIDKIIKKVE